jgi:2-polyprenyl-6-methoxyphenol hydroxylase-like FAD-dependent oxidoreductase
MDILISGAGVAGLALALNLGTRGHRVVVVERASHLRVNGSPIDVRGEAIRVAEAMGLLAPIRRHRVRMTEEVVWVDSDDVAVARTPADQISDSDDDIEIAREDLTRILARALSPDTTIRFRDSVDAITDDAITDGGDGVEVHFTSGAREHFDLVLGADGLHSAVRRLTFGPEHDYLRHLGLYVALTDLPGENHSVRRSPMYNFPDHLAGIARYNGRALGVLLFRTGLIDYDHHDVDAQKKIGADAFGDTTSWKVPQLLDAVRDDSEFYFDSVSQIHMPTWHEGRVALVGDAAHCASLLSGRGTSLALTGAYILAEELTHGSDDLATAFERYEARQRPYVELAQNSVGDGAAIMVPASWEAIAERNERFPLTREC